MAVHVDSSSSVGWAKTMPAARPVVESTTIDPESPRAAKSGPVRATLAKSRAARLHRWESKWWHGHRG